MEIRNNAEAMKAFLGVSSPGSTQVQLNRNADTAASHAAFAGDQATLSQAAEVLQSADGPDVRMDKVAAVQQALAAGTYSVPAEKVAEKMIDTMLAGGLGSNQ
jgi:negative regulator of flagellin synthesis FlgM